MHSTTTTTITTSVLGSLRALLPTRRLCLDEALRMAELQADRLLRLCDIEDMPVPLEVVTELPRITIEYDDELARHDASGVSRWDHDRRTWVITLNPEEPTTRARFTVLHEYKHILDHYHPGLGGRLPRHVFGLEPVEYVAEYFAGCVLMPRRWVKAAYFDGVQQARDLAQLFGVSRRAMEVRLDQLGIRRASDEPLTGARYRRQPGARQSIAGPSRFSIRTTPLDRGPAA